MRHIGGAKIVDHRQLQHSGECCAIADLNRELRLRTMKNRLSVKADDIDTPAIDRMLRHVRLDAFGMHLRDQFFCLTQGAGPR